MFGTRIGDKSGGWLPGEIFDVIKTVRGVAFHADRKIHVERVKKALVEPFGDGNRVFVVIHFTVYPPFCYLPQALGIAAGRFCGLSVMGMMYAGRFAALLCWIAFVFIAIRLTPVFKWVIMLVALMPMTIFLASSLSADTMIISCSILFVALVMHVSAIEKRLSLGVRIALIVLGTAVAMMKLVYLPIVFLVFLIPSEKFGGARGKVFYCSAIASAAIASAAIWSIEIKRVYIHLNNSNMHEQISFILANPLHYMLLLWKTIRTEWYSYLISFTGVLGWLDTLLSRWIYRTYYLLLIGAALIDGGSTPSFSFRSKTFVIGASCLIVILVATSQYLAWTKPGASVLEGVQGRYFIPVAIPVLLTLYNRKASNLKNCFSEWAVIIYIMLVLASACFTVYQRYYGQ